MEVKEKNFFQKVWTSIRDFEGYEEFAAGKVTKAIIYVLLLTLIFSIIIAITYTYKFYSAIQSTSNYVAENVDEIKMVDGKLEITSNKDSIIEDENAIIPIIIADTSKEANKEEYIKKIKAYETGILFLSDRALLISNNIANETEVYYSNIFQLNIDGKEEFLNLFEFSNLFPTYIVFFLTMFVYLVIIYFMSNIMDAVVLGALGYVFARLMRLKLKYKASFNIGAYAITLPVILNLIYIIVNTFTGFEIKYFQWMYTTISYIYVVVAILMIKTEIINQKIQLIRLREIQEQAVKEEQVQEEESKKEEQEENKEEEKKNSDKAPGEEPEGSNA